MEREISWKSPKIMIVFAVSLLALVGLLIVAQRVNAPIEFADPQLESVVREKIGKPVEPIYLTDLMSVIELDAGGRGIQRLEGIEALRRLAVLNLADNAVDDLTPLRKLRMLKVLDLSNNHITDLGTVHFEAITHLGLRELNLQDNTINDVTLLGDLRQLEALTLRHNQVQAVEALAQLTKLQDLDLRGNQVADIQPLQALSQLRVLNLRENAIRDLEPLADLTGLQYLNIHSNPVEQGLAVLGNLTQLETLIMRNVFIGEGYSFLENLTQLQRLNIRNSGIGEVAVIGRLMAAGALQDNPETGVRAVIDLLEIDPEGNGQDPYGSLRRYWDNISSRYPLSLPYYPSEVNPPQFSHESGFYEEGFYLTLTTDEPGGRIFFTTDGSEPALTPELAPMGSTQEYVQAIMIENRTSQPNDLSLIRTGYWLDQHIPPSEVFKSSVIRAVVVSQDGAVSNFHSQTYFVAPEMAARFSLPVVSILSVPDHLFGDELGIYVPGDSFIPPAHDQHWTEEVANFFQRGLKWERPAVFQMFDPTGDLLVEQNIGIRIHGGYTRGFDQKSLRLYFREDYDPAGLMHYDLFPDLNGRLNDHTVDTFETLILRNGGNDWRIAIFRDVMAHSLLEPTRLDIQGFQPVIMFINGEYWGIHNLRTRYDEYYFESYYGLQAGEVVILEDDGFGTALIMGEEGDEQLYFDLLKSIDEDFVDNDFQTVATLADPQVYDAISSQIDLENFVTYYAAQMYFNNTDWPYNNVRLWRKKTDAVMNEQQPFGHDGKWRWMVLDVDRALRDDVTQNNLLLATERVQIENFLFRSLLENESFRIQFINGFADLLNTLFREEVVVEKIDYLEQVYRPEINQQIHRWGQPAPSLDGWLSAVDEMRIFALLRPTHQRQHLLSFFNLPGLSQLTLQTDPSRGFIRVNTLNLQEGEVGVDNPGNWSGVYFKGVPIQLSAVPMPGYRFVEWQGVEDYDVEAGAKTITLDLVDDLQITAIFAEAD